MRGVPVDASSDVDDEKSRGEASESVLGFLPATSIRSRSRFSFRSLGWATAAVMYVYLLVADAVDLLVTVTYAGHRSGPTVAGLLPSLHTTLPGLYGRLSNGRENRVGFRQDVFGRTRRNAT